MIRKIKTAKISLEAATEYYGKRYNTITVLGFPAPGVVEIEMTNTPAKAPTAPGHNLKLSTKKFNALAAAESKCYANGQ